MSKKRDRSDNLPNSEDLPINPQNQRGLSMAEIESALRRVISSDNAIEDQDDPELEKIEREKIRSVSEVEIRNRASGALAPDPTNEFNTILDNLIAVPQNTPNSNLDDSNSANASNFFDYSSPSTSVIRPQIMSSNSSFFIPSSKRQKNK